MYNSSREKSAQHQNTVAADLNCVNSQQFGLRNDWLERQR